MNNDNSVKLNWADSNGVSIYASVSGVQSKVTALSGDEFLKMFDPAWRSRLTENAKRVVHLISNDKEVPKVIREVVASKRFLADLPEDEQRREIKTCSTAMFPNYECKYVIVGCAGSVWVECRLHGKNARIGIDPNAQSALKAFYIDYAD